MAAYKTLLPMSSVGARYIKRSRRLFHWMQVVSLQKLYAEVERTGRAHQYEEKQGLRLYFLRVVGKPPDALYNT